MDAPRPPQDSSPAHQEQTRRLVGAMMKLTGLSATGLARSAGLTPSTIHRFMHKPVRHTLSQRTMLALMTETFLALKDRARQSLDQSALTELAPAISVYERGILERAPDVMPILMEAKTAGTRGATAPATSSADELPVLMTATQGINIAKGDFARAPLKTQRPPFLAGDPQAFAILMPDESMMPRYDAGDMLYVSPARNAEGEKADVVIERNGGFMIGSMVASTAASVRIATFSPQTRTNFERDKIRGPYRIVGVQRLG
jgi:hypothetical protein